MSGKEEIAGVLYFPAKKPMMRKITLLLALALAGLTTTVSAQADTITKKKWHWGGGTADTSAGYAQAVLVDNVLYVSGVPGRGTITQQLQGAYRGIEATLKAYGLSFHHVVKENLYALDIEAVKANNHIRKAFYKGDYPAATWVQIARLYMPEALVEVEVIAHMPKR